ncbi:fungal specific transcription factor domain-containing protein [Trichoderma breve]|uniref:Fungal specific transcription factor domain-containing protein n=1 Tax=Trichoderma breve TaxID=2034170 RepID=A0A9W9E3M7_9HYPO|nr:fungal specific transcription factor domain-containing protein [Trichoderma breve]KAJ4856894.1 fungal specific transcription factor domain-containing protein [Trichoderma breve]
MAESLQNPLPNISVNQGQPEEYVPRRRNRTGCLTCRRRRKRCDGVRDVCGHCIRLNLICHWQDPRNIGEGSASSSHPVSQRPRVTDHSCVPLTIPIAPAPFQFLQSDAPELARRSLDRKLALRYYVQIFNTMLTTNLENNGFLSVLLPMAIEEKALLDMLIAWSSSHLSLCDDTYRIKALEHRSTALQSFTSSLSKNESPEVSLACCLVFCSMSAVLGDTAEWRNHLVGAAHIIRHAWLSSTQDESLKNPPYEIRWLLRNFAYHDILMSVTLDREPLIPGRYWIPQPMNELDSYVGLASEPLALISKISSLNGDAIRQMESSSPCSTYSIEFELQDWKCPESNSRCLVNLAEAYRSSALIHLYRVMRRRILGSSTELEGKIASQVTSIVYQLEQMPLGCLPECTSLFPLFMAGGETRSKSTMQFIRERLQHIATYRHFQNAASALSVLEELWLQHTSITGTMNSHLLDWLDIIRRRHWELALS